MAEKDDRLGFDTVAFAVGGRDGVGAIENLAFGLRTRVRDTTLADLPATMTGMFFDRVRDDKIAEHWAELSFPNFLQALTGQVHGPTRRRRTVISRSEGWVHFPGSYQVAVECGQESGEATWRATSGWRRSGRRPSGA
jgi:hypothetical protein